MCLIDTGCDSPPSQSINHTQQRRMLDNTIGNLNYEIELIVDNYLLQMVLISKQLTVIVYVLASPTYLPIGSYLVFGLTH
jgi:hypothetical protein